MFLHVFVSSVHVGAILPQPPLCLGLRHLCRQTTLAPRSDVDLQFPTLPQQSLRKGNIGWPPTACSKPGVADLDFGRFHPWLGIQCA